MFETSISASVDFSQNSSSNTLFDTNIEGLGFIPSPASWTTAGLPMPSK